MIPNDGKMSVIEGTSCGEVDDWSHHVFENDWTGRLRNVVKGWALVQVVDEEDW